jgi:integrase
MYFTLSENDINDLIKQLKQTKTKFIDGEILGNAIKMIFESGLKKKELSELTINDVLIKNGKIDGLKLKSGGKLSLNRKARRTLDQHINYLKNNQYPVQDVDPLFPGYFGDKGKRQFSRHLREAQKNNIVDVNDIHRAAVTSFYNKGNDLKKTAKHFRIDEDSVKDLLNDNYHKPKSHSSTHSIDDDYDGVIDPKFSFK